MPPLCAASEEPGRTAETYAVASAASSVRSSRSASSSPTTSGGLSLSTLRRGPSVESSTPARRACSTTAVARSVVGQLDAEEQPFAADVGDRVVALAEAAQAGLDPLAEPRGVRLQALVGDHVEHRQPDRARDGVAAEGVEVLHPGLERARDRRRGDHRAERVAVADRLAERDDVGHDVLELEAPERVGPRDRSRTWTSSAMQTAPAARAGAYAARR